MGKEALIYSRKEKLEKLKKYAHTLFEDRIDGTVFDFAIMDALDSLNKRFIEGGNRGRKDLQERDC